MSNVTTLSERRDTKGKPLDWLARGLEAQLRNDAQSEAVMITIDRTEAINLVRMIDALNAGGKDA